MKHTYVVCIPSYKRSQVCNDKTLATLHKMGIPKHIIHVYVANNEEYEVYKNTLDKRLYDKLHVGVLGLVQQREYIMSQWKEGQHIVFLDDDIASIDLSLSPLFQKKTLNQFIEHAFKTCKEHKAFIWGVYPVFNPFFRAPKQECTTYLTYVVGAFYGIINRPRLNTRKLRLTMTRKTGQKEDVERTIKYFLNDGVIIRFNKIGFVTKYYGKEGGLGTFQERLKPMRDAAIALEEKYPELGYVIERKTGMTEFRLRRLP